MNKVDLTVGQLFRSENEQAYKAKAQETNRRQQDVNASVIALFSTKVKRPSEDERLALVISRRIELRLPG